MKRLLIFLFWLSAGYGLINAQSITVTSPNGGESWAGATVQNITWTAVSVTTVNIEFTTNNGSSWTTIVSSHPGLSSPFPWTVPGAGPLGSTQCLVRVTSSSNSLITDQSNAVFSIPASGLTIIYPNGGETFYNGEARSIRWTTLSVVNADLHYSTDNGNSWVLIVASIPANLTFYTWTPPSGINSPVMRIRIQDNSINSVADLNDGTFRLLPSAATNIGKFKGGSFDGYSYDNNRPKTIVVNSPNGGEVWSGATTQNINWTSQNVDNVKIEYSSNAGSTWNTIQATYPAGTGTYPWVVPGAGPSGSTTMLVRVSNATDPALFDQSNAYWTIPAAIITVLSPNGGEDFYNGTLRPIRWSSQSVVNMRIEYSTNNGSAWVLIDDSIPAARTFYSWTVPSGINSSACKVRLRDRVDYSIEDMNNANFRILPGAATNIGKFKGGSFDGYSADNSAPKSLTLLTPNGGEVWSGSTTQSISWTSQNISNVRIEYSTNNGSNWILVIDPYPAGTGSYSWLVPGAGPGGTTTARVRVLDAADNSLNDQSNNTWTIPPSSITILSPDGGEDFFNGTMRPIRWSSQSVIDVRLDYSTNNGSNWILITEPVSAALTFYGWTVPSGINSAVCKVRVRDYTDVSVLDITAGVFKILPASATNIGKFKGGSYDGYATDFGCIEPVATLTGAQTVCPGNSANLTVTLQNTPPWTLYWSDGTNTSSQSGINNSPFVFSVSPSANTTYTLTNLTGGCQGVVFGQATVNINTPPNVTLSGNNTIMLGQGTQLTFNLSGSSPWNLTYTNGTSLFTQNGITGSPYLTSVSPTADVTYSPVSVSNLCAGSVSGSAAITVNSIPIAALSGTQSLCAGTPAQLSVAISGPSPWTLTWTDGNTQTTVSGLTQSPYLISITPGISTTYSLVSVTNPLSGNVSGTAIVSVTPLLTSVTGLQLNGPQTCTTLNWSWNTLSGANAYYVDIATDQNFTQIYVDGINNWQNNLLGNTNSLNLTGVPPNTTLYLRVRGNSICGASPNITGVSGSTRPSPSTLVSSAGTSVGCSGFTANWSLDANADNYQLLVGPDSSFISNFQNISTGNVQNYGVGSLNENTVYYWKVRGVNTCGSNGAYSQVRIIRTIQLSDSINTFTNSPVCVGASLNLTGVSTYPGVVFNWSGPLGYTASGNQVSISNIQSNASGIYTVNASASGCIAFIATSSVSVISIPGSVTGLQSINPACTDISWSWNSVSGATAYYADLSSDQNFNTFLSGWQNSLLGNISTITLTGQNPGTTVYARIRASNFCGVSSDITGVTGNTIALPAQAVLSSAQSLSCNGFIANWNNNSNTTGYELEVSLNNTFTNRINGYNPLSTGNVLTSQVNGLTENTQYFWRVRSVNSCGVGNFSAFATMRTVLLSDSVQISSNSPVCRNETLSLNGFSTYPGVSYSWNGPAGFTGSGSGIVRNAVTPNEAGVYSLTAIATGCTNVLLNTLVQVNDSVLTLVRGGNTTLCSGENLVLTSSGNMSGLVYNWSGPNGFTSGNATAQINSVPVLGQGVYTIAVTSPGCNVISDTITVNIIPTVAVTASNNSPVCQGDAVYLNVTSVPGSPYQWTGPGGFASSQQNPAISQASPSNNGVYTITVLQQGCNPLHFMTTVTVSSINNAVTVSSNSPVCNGNVLQLSASTISGAVYFWSGPNGFTSNQISPQISGAGTINSGQYSLMVTNPGCTNAARNLNVVVYPNLVISAGSNSPVCQGNNLQFSSSTHTLATYLWTGPNGYNSNLQNPSFPNSTLNLTGTYSLTITQPGCGAQNTTVPVTIGTSPAPVNVIHNSPVCVGNTLGITANSLSGLNYQWISPDGFTSNQTVIQRTNVQSGSAGIYSLTLTSVGCNPRLIPVLININTPIVLSAGTPVSPICSGTVLNLTSTSGTGVQHSWSGPNGFISTAQNPSIINTVIQNTGIYTLITSQAGCGSSSATVSVQVGASVNSVSAGSNSPICINNTIHLSATLVSGVTYAWSGPGGFTSNSSSNSIVNALQNNAGNYQLQVTSPGCGSQNFTVKVVINDPSGISVSNSSPVCGGAVVYLYSTATRGSTYSWAGPNGFVSSLQNPALSNSNAGQSGIYTVTITDPTCGAVVRTTTVQIGANLNSVAPSSNTPICQTGTLNMSSTTIQGATYLWAGPNGFTSATQNPSVSNVSALEAGVYSVTVSTVGCLSITRTMNVVINPALTAIPGSNSPVCQASVVYLNSNSIPGASYSWTGPNGFISTQSNPSLINAQPVVSGVYTLTISAQGCGSASATTSVLVGGSITNVSLNSNSPVCTNNTLNLVSSLVSSGTILWTAPDGFTSNLQNPARANMQPSEAGLYTFTAMSPGCGNTTRTITVVVNPTLSLNAGNNSPLCQGNALSLTVNSITGSTYSWSGPLAYVSSVQNPSISNAQPTRSGIYTLTVNSSTCGIITTTTSVIVGSSLGNITATSNNPVCVGNSLNLTATDRLGFQFSWSGPNGFASTLIQPTVSNVTTLGAGRYTVQITSPGCGVSTVQTSVIMVNNPASVSATSTSPVCTNSAIYFTGSAPSGTTYSWSGPVGFASTVQGPSRSNALLSYAGVYTLNANVPACGVVVRTTNVFVITCRMNENASATDKTWGENITYDESVDLVNKNEESQTITESYGRLTVWPNPNSGNNLMLKWEGLSNQDNSITVRIFDATGKEVLLKSLKYDLSGNASDSVNFPIKLSVGIYTIETVHDSRFVYTKLIVE